MATSMFLKNNNDSSYPFLELQNNNSNAFSGEIRFIKKKQVTEGSDPLGLISFQAYDDGDNTEKYAQIKVVADDITNTTEDGKIIFSTIKDGSLTDILQLTGTTSTFDNHIQTGSEKEIRFMEGSNYVGFKAPALTGDQIWTLPNSDGSADQVLKTNGSGVLSWVTQSGGGSSNFTTPTATTITFSSYTADTLLSSQFSIPANSVLTRIVFIVTSTILLDSDGTSLFVKNILKSNNSSFNLMSIEQNFTTTSEGGYLEVNFSDDNNHNSNTADSGTQNYGITFCGSTSDISISSPAINVASGEVKVYIEYITYS